MRAGTEPQAPPAPAADLASAAPAAQKERQVQRRCLLRALLDTHCGAASKAVACGCPRSLWGREGRVPARGARRTCPHRLQRWPGWRAGAGGGGAPGASKGQEERQGCQAPCCNKGKPECRLRAPRPLRHRSSGIRTQLKRDEYREARPAGGPSSGRTAKREPPVPGCHSLRASNHLYPPSGCALAPRSAQPLDPLSR